MRTLWAALCLALVTHCSGQAITRLQLTNYAVGMNAGKRTNGVEYGTLRITNDAETGFAPNVYIGHNDGTLGAFFGWNIGGQQWSFIVQSNTFQLNETSPFASPYFEFWKDQGSGSIGRGGVMTNNGDLRVTGTAYDQNNRRYVTTIDSSNDVQVVAGAGMIVSKAGAGQVVTYTVTSTAGAGATNAVSAISTNGGIGGLGITSLVFNNGYGNTVAGVSNNGSFTLTLTVDFGPATNYVNAVGLLLTNFIQTLVYQVGANNTNFAQSIGLAATNLANAYSVALTNALAAKQDGYANLSELGNSGIRFPSAGFQIESNLNQILWAFTPTVVFTNSASSNLTVNVRTNKYYITATNNITVTNFVGIQSGVASDTTIIIEPQLIPRGITYPTLGGASFGIYANTNDNSQMWTTLTNGNRYALTISAFGTNTFWSLSRWK